MREKEGKMGNLPWLYRIFYIGSTILYHTLPYSATLYIILCHTLPHSTIPCHTLPHSATLYHTLPHPTILYHTLLFTSEI